MKLRLDLDGKIVPEPRLLRDDPGDSEADRAEKYRLAQAATLIDAAEIGDYRALKVLRAAGLWADTSEPPPYGPWDR